MLQRLASAVLTGFLVVSAAAQTTGSQDAFLKPGDNLVIENIPPIPLSIADQTARYGKSQSALLYSWNSVSSDIIMKGTQTATLAG